MRERYGAVHDWMQQSNWILLFRGMAIPPMPPHSKRAWLHGVRIDMALHLILNRSRMKPLAILTCVLMMAFMPAYGEGLSNMPSPQASFRGVFFNPQLGSNPVFSELYYRQYRPQIRTILQEMHETADINLVAMFIIIPHTLLNPGQGNQAGQTIEQWGNLAYLDNVALFIDDCSEAGIAVELDLADNRWIPYTVDSEHHIGKPNDPWWPVADDTPWDESAEWYSQIINYVESHAAHPGNIAMWCMSGNYTLGGSEPVLWGESSTSPVIAHTEKFVKNVWPAFRAAGKRPKAAPYMLPILSKTAYWMKQPPEARLSAFVNVKKWLVDDLALPPDYWPMTTYPFCDPAPDGVYYLRRIVEIIGKENASRILSTDLKGPGHEYEMSDCIVPTKEHFGPEVYEWQLQKCAEYGFAGWWIWAYQDTAHATSGIRSLNGEWKQDLVRAIKPEKASGGK